MNSDNHNLDEGDWELLLERISDKKCTPIIGSGAVTGGPPQGVTADKWNFQYPIDAMLAQQWATQFNYPLEDATRIERVAQFMSVEKDPSWPRDSIARRLAKADPPNFTLENETHRVLAELKLPVYITSNFDDYLERALLAADADVHLSICRWNKHFPQDAPALEADPAKRDLVQTYAAVGNGEEPRTLVYNPAGAGYKPTAANPLVYHFHGHMTWPASLVVTEDDYFEFLINLAREPSRILPLIQEIFGYRSLLFLGYKLSDWNFLVIFRLLAKAIKESGSKHIAVQLGPMSGAQAADETKAESAARYLGSYFDKQGNIKVYWGTCQQFIAELKRRRG